MTLHDVVTSFVRNQVTNFLSEARRSTAKEVLPNKNCSITALIPTRSAILSPCAVSVNFGKIKDLASLALLMQPHCYPSSTLKLDRENFTGYLVQQVGISQRFQYLAELESRCEEGRSMPVKNNKICVR